jgi:hypothetical protein
MFAVRPETTSGSHFWKTGMGFFATMAALIPGIFSARARAKSRSSALHNALEAI